MPALETIRAVPIARVGTWETSTGKWVCTQEQLHDAVRAAQDPSFRAGVLKIGHTDPRFNAGDGTPAVGRLDNLRVEASGDVLLADLVGVPAWLADVLHSAYPSRSVEASLGVVTADGNAYAMVVTGLALLGQTPPAIESLADVARLYDPPPADTWVAAARVAASIPQGAPVTSSPPAPAPTAPVVPAVVAASIPVDDLTEQATRYARQNGIQDPWVREVWTDKVIVMGGDADAAPGSYADDLFEIGWTETDGALAFTGPWEVRVEYQRINDQDGDPWDKPGPGVQTVPPDGGVTAAAPGAEHAGQRGMGTRASTMPIHYVRGRGDVPTSTPEEPPPVSDIATQVRERLGLAPDATDEQVTAALDKRLATGDPSGSTPQSPPAGQPTEAPPASAPTPAPEPVHASREAIEQLVQERVAAAVAPFRDRLEATSTELAARKEADRVKARDELLASAVAAGKITPAEQPKWLELYDKGPESATAVQQVFASLAKGTAVPVAATAGAHTGGTEPTGDGFTDEEYRRLFPEDNKAVSQ